MSESSTGSGAFRLEPLNATNWMPWKRRMEAVLRELELHKYITEEGKTKPSASADAAIWEKGESKARTRLELAIGDSEMAHIIGTKTAFEIWERLCQVKEAKGRLGILATRRALYRSQAHEGADMVEHVNNLRSLQAELGLLGNEVADEDFVMILIASLPESWDVFATSYLGSHTGATTLTASEFIPLLLEEDRRRRARAGGSENSLQARFGKSSGSSKTDKICHNCNKKGHYKRDCWAKGGGMEGKGPKGRKGKERTNQATEDSPDLNTAVAVAYMARSDELDTSKLVWHLDSGTTSHICTMRDAFQTYTPLHNATVRGVGPDVARVEGTGSIILKFKVGNDVIAHEIKDALHVPGAPNCLLSVSRFDDGGGEVGFRKGECVLRNKDGKVVGTGRKEGRLYKLDARAVLIREQANFATSDAKSWDHWHRVLGHIGISTLEKMHQKHVVDGFTIDESSIPSRTCTSCLEAKLTRQPYPKQAETRCEKPGEGFHSDVWGPIATQSIGKFRYYISFTDDCTRFVKLYFLKDKGEAADKIAHQVAAVEMRFGKPPAWIKFDNGKELVNERTKALCAGKGIELRTIAPYSPSQNGVAERLNRTLLEAARAMMLAKQMPAYLWDEAVSHAVYLRNRTLVSALPDKTPYQAYVGKKPSVAHLREFGSDVWVLDESVGRSKLAPKANKMVFVGIMEGSKSVRYYDPKTRNVKVSRNIAFNENQAPVELPSLGLEEEITTPTDQDLDPKVDTQIGNSPIKDQHPETSAQKDDNYPPLPYTQEPSLPPDLIEPPQIPKLRTRTTTTDYKKYGNPSARTPAASALERKEKQRRTQEIAAQRQEKEERNRTLYSNVTMEEVLDPDAPLPRNIGEAMASPEGEEWRSAVQEELGMLKKMGTWELKDLPEGRDVVGCKWVFARKLDEKGQVVRHKARLVAQGFSQKPGMDFDLDGTFAPVMRLETLRSALALASILGLRVFQLDFKNAYLNGTLKRPIYMRQPPGFDDGTGRVCELLRTLYGLRQSGNEWNREFNDAVLAIGFTQLKSDYCCYIRRSGGVVTILLLWVDDILGFTNSDEEETLVAKELGQRFEIKVLGRPGMLLGMKVHQSDDRRVLTLSQSHYIDSILKRIGLEDANPVSTPLDSNVNLDSIDSPPITDTAEASRASGLYATALG